MYDNDAINKEIHRRVEAIIKEKNIDVVTDFNQLLAEWNLVCTTMAEEFMAEGLVESAKSAMFWVEER